MSAKICRLHPDNHLLVQWKCQVEALFEADEWEWVSGEPGAARAHLFPSHLAAERFLETDRVKRGLEKADGFPVVVGFDERLGLERKQRHEAREAEAEESARPMRVVRRNVTRDWKGSIWHECDLLLR